MNILYCGDSCVSSGIFLSALSLGRHAGEPLHIFILTADVGPRGALTNAFAKQLQKALNSSEHCKALAPRRAALPHRVTLLNITELFLAEPPAANLNTRFTPLCMLRLFADKVPAIPNKILYLDGDVLCRANFSAFYATDLTAAEIVGVPDRYGKWFFGNPLRHNYLNSGVLLLNMQKIRQSGLFFKCRLLCQSKKMFMPDQTALNKLAVKQKAPGKYNAQGRFNPNAVFWHFTTHFKFLPYFRPVTVKPWQVEPLHEQLNIFEFDDLLKVLENYQKEF